MGYLFLSSSEEKIEASESLSTVAGEPIIVVTETGFKPKNVTVKQGTQVTWINEDVEAHRIAFRLGSTLENLTHLDQELKQGESLTFKFEFSGKFSYLDKNSSFEGTVTVL